MNTLCGPVDLTDVFLRKKSVGSQTFYKTNMCIVFFLKLNDRKLVKGVLFFYLGCVLNILKWQPHSNHHHYGLVTHHVLIYNSILKKVIRKSYSKNRNFKIQGIKKTQLQKKFQIYSLGQPWAPKNQLQKSCRYIHLGSHGPPNSYILSFLNQSILPTAEDMNIFTMVSVVWSNSRGRLPRSNRTFCCLSKKLIK